MAVERTRRRFTVDEYHWMARVGILGEDDRVELIDGEIVEMSPMGPGHAATVTQQGECLSREFSDLAQVRIQCPIHLSRHNEPEPDLALVRRRVDGYRFAHPASEDIFLVVEVSDTTLVHDPEVKVPLYAWAGIPETWLMNLPDDRIEVYRDPAPEGYRSITLVPRDGAVTPLTFPDVFPDVTILCAELLP